MTNLTESRNDFPSFKLYMSVSVFRYSVFFSLFIYLTFSCIFVFSFFFGSYIWAVSIIFFWSLCVNGMSARMYRNSCSIIPLRCDFLSKCIYFCVILSSPKMVQFVQLKDGELNIRLHVHWELLWAYFCYVGYHSFSGKCQD